MQSPTESQLVYFVSGMWCTSCAQGVRTAVTGTEGVKSAEVNYASKLLIVECGEGGSDEIDRKIRDEVSRIGFGIKRQSAGWVLQFREELEAEMNEKISWVHLSLVWFLAMWSSMLAFARYAGSGLGPQEIFGLAVASALFGLPAILLGIIPYARSGWRALLYNRRLTLDLFICLGGLSATAVSIFALLTSRAVSYADSGSMIVALLLLTKKVENTVIHKITLSILGHLLPDREFVRVWKQDQWQTGEMARVRAGDRVSFRAGETLCFDGNIMGHGARVNAHLLTGEGNAVELVDGDDVFAGSIALTNLEMKVAQPLGRRRIDAWAETALTGKARHSYFISRLEGYLTGAALTGAVLLAALSVLRGGTFTQAAESFFIGVLVFCPCLFASIIPLSRQMAHLALFRVGVVLSRSEALLDLARTERFYFDKTGTLEAVESEFQPYEGDREVVPYLGEMAARSAHPILRRLSNSLDEKLLTSFEETPGQGATAVTDKGDVIVIGQGSYLQKRGVVTGKRWDRDFPAVAFRGKPVGQILVKKIYDAKARHFLRRLLKAYPRAQIAVLSGDPSDDGGRPLANLSERISYRGGLSPEAKAALVGERSVYVGDGLNDTLAMARADVSFRLGRRVRASAPVDFYLPTPNLDLILGTLKYARKYRRVLFQTTGLAFSYNLIALALAASGHFSPLGAVLAMLLSFSFLLLSSLRLLKIEVKR